MQTYPEKINAFISRLSAPALDALAQISTASTYVKGAFLLRQGEVCRHSFLLESGIVRKYYLNDGKEITTAFFFAGDIMVAMESYTRQLPSTEYLQAITDCGVTQMTFSGFEQAKTQYPELLQLDLLLTEYYAIWLENRLWELQTLSATQRYALLLKNEPQLIRQVSLTHIAGYLGVSLETLSRIRARK